MKRRTFTSVVAGLGLAASMMGTTAMAQDNMRIALVVKALGIGFFEAAAEGAEEAAAELGNVEIIYTGPTDTTAEGQIEVINSLIAQGVDAIAISANDPDAVAPALQRAMQRGITVISWDSGVNEDGRMMHLNPSSTPLIGNTIIKLAADHLPDGGQVAILSALRQDLGHDLRVLDDPCLVVAEPGFQRFLQGDGLGRDHVHQGPALRARKHE